MVLPVTGPHQTSFVLPQPGLSTPHDIVWTKQRWRQAKPYDRPLQYLSGGAYVQSRTGTQLNGSGASAEQAALVNFPSGVYNDLVSKAYDKLKENAFSTAQLSVSLVEAEQSIRSLRQRALQLAAFTLALSRGKYKAAANVLTMTDPPKRVGRIKSGAGQWLEYHLGWEPAVKDIGNAIDVLQQPIKNTRAHARSTWGELVVESNNWPPPDWSRGQKRVYEMLAVEMGIEVGIDNPNLFLANNLGFVNPVSVAWELVPFSFIVDWFINVGQVISSYTDFLGLSVQNAYTTTHMKGTWQERWGDTPGGEAVFSWWKTDRQTVLAGPTLHIKKLRPLSLARGATAISLLVGQLRSLK